MTTENAVIHLTIEEVARVAHNVNRSYCESIGDVSQVTWESAPEWQKHSAKQGVKFCLNNPEAPPSANHDSWLAVKQAEGWTYGDVKDEEKRTHPCCVPYDELPPEQKSKDYLFKAVVGALKRYTAEGRYQELEMAKAKAEEDRKTYEEAKKREAVAKAEVDRLMAAAEATNE